MMPPLGDIFSMVANQYQPILENIQKTVAFIQLVKNYMICPGKCQMIASHDFNNSTLCFFRIQSRPANIMVPRAILNFCLFSNNFPAETGSRRRS
jgi:hypothetical protein